MILLLATISIRIYSFDSKKKTEYRVRCAEPLQLKKQEPTAADLVCKGWFLEIHAVTDFAIQQGSEIIPIHKGEDIRSHLNIVTNFYATPEAPITETRKGGDH
jgi:hypothetical protein